MILHSEPKVAFTDWVGALLLSTSEARDEHIFYSAGRHVIFTLRGRTAVTLALKLLKITSSDCILFPAYHCGCELEAIICEGVKIQFYDVNKNAEPLLDLSCPPHDSVKALYVIHSFGFPLSLDLIRNWCDYHKILLIEDCANVFPEIQEQTSVGRYGDATVYSPRKFIGTNYGGILTVKSGLGISEQFNLTSCPRSIMVRELIHLLFPEGIKYFIKNLKAYTINQNIDKNINNYFSSKILNYNWLSSKKNNSYISHLWFQMLMRYIAWKEISNKRISNYELLSERISRMDCPQPLIKLNTNSIVPLNFPVFIKERDKMIQHMRSLGVCAVPWWSGFYSGLIHWENFPNSVMLKKHVLTLPIHQGILPDQINLIADSLIHAKLE